MLPLLISSQIREADAFTIAHEPIDSLDLMERASRAFVGWFINRFAERDQSISIYCGTGNNGGDGLAIARILYDHGYTSLNIKIARFASKSTKDFNQNLKRIKLTEVAVTELQSGSKIPVENSGLIIDALLGSGLNKPLEGDYKKLVEHLNGLNRTIVSVDVPTGFFADGEIPDGAIGIKAGLVITFQQPKINFMLPESAPYLDCWEAVNIGISTEFTNSLNSPYQAVEEKDVKELLKPRHHFSNKGTYGHALLVAGQAETMGAALLCSVACAHTGAGLTTACIPQSGLTALNSYMPEVMAIVRQGSQLPQIKWDSFDIIGIGPGLGKEKDSLVLLQHILTHYEKPLVIDADALNLLSEHPALWNDVPEGSVITPHMKEFDRLFGDHANWWQRMQTGMSKAKEYKVVILLKNDYTLTITPQGKVYFNTTSNPAMATGGMGDVLTGIITSLLAQKYTAEQACIIGAFIHGKAGDELALTNRMNVVLPGQVSARIPATMAKLLA